VTTAALLTRDLTKIYGTTRALDGCTLEIPRSRVAALIGANGAGKSTLLRCAARLARPSGGDLEVLGRAVDRAGADEFAAVAYLDQAPPLFNGFTVEEMLRFGAKTNARWDRAIVTAYLGEFGIRGSTRVRALSGGQRIHLALALCLGKQPELLLLDEPASALDPLARQELLMMLMEQVARTGSSVVLSTHALGDVAAVCDFIVVMRAGRVVLADETEFIEATHMILECEDQDAEAPPDVEVIESQRLQHSVAHLVRAKFPVVDGGWRTSAPSLDEIVLGYLRASRAKASV
jgi:ABC-2 type transport system ATP-binding protein